MKWVAGSFFIQFGLIFFIFTPMILQGSLGEFGKGFPIELMVVAVIFSAFIDLQVINVSHYITNLRFLENFNLGMNSWKTLTWG